MDARGFASGRWLVRLAAALLALLLLPAPAPAGRGEAEAAGCEPEVAASAEAAFREAIDLWKDGRYEALYERGYLEQQAALPVEDFVRLMRREDRKLQCCWLTLRQVRLLCDGPEVWVRARIGYEVAGYLFDPARQRWARDTAPRDVDELWRLRWQAGAWRVDLYQILGPALLYYEKRPGGPFAFDFPR
ncbi:MAG TPA: hypothetical protein VNM66_00245, partial [Thermodesulfobacteriota bacterium]|nr:hypothetical protein [Thermodesulfobacteriota bacterium]